MHAFLINGDSVVFNTNAISQKLIELGISQFDVFRLNSDGAAIGIGEIREWSKKLNLMPQHSPLLAGVIENSHLMTTEAQNALLKLLEEPPLQTVILIETKFPNMLLPTIQSRLSVIKVESETQITSIQIEFINLCKSLIASDFGKRLSQIDKILKTKEDAATLTDLFIVNLHTLLRSGDISNPELKQILTLPKIQKLIRKLFIARRQLQVNVNPKLVIDNVFLWI
jgi:DNA polymerase III gamma/tau subunit